MDTFELERFIKTHNSFETAREGFWQYVNAWREEEPEEFLEAFESDDISTSTKLLNEKIALVINYRWDNPIKFVQTTLNVEVNDRIVAQYHLLQSLDGKGMDDALSFSSFNYLPKNKD